MSKATILEHDTFLFSGEAPAGRLFAAGAAHPGEGWADEPAAPLDLAMTLDDFATRVIEPALAGLDPAVIEAAVAEAVTKALDEQAAKFDTAYEAVTSENTDLRGQITSLQEDLRQANAKIAEQAALIAKFDPDGDGKPGGSAPKAAK